MTLKEKVGKFLEGLPSRCGHVYQSPKGGESKETLLQKWNDGYRESATKNLLCNLPDHHYFPHLPLLLLQMARLFPSCTRLSKGHTHDEPVISSELWLSSLSTTASTEELSLEKGSIWSGYRCACIMPWVLHCCLLMEGRVMEGAGGGGPVVEGLVVDGLVMEGPGDGGAGNNAV